MADPARCSCGQSLHEARDGALGGKTCPACGATVFPSDIAPAYQPLPPLAPLTSQERGEVPELDLEKRASVREWVYLLLAVALVPLGVNSFSGRPAPLAERLSRSLDEMDEATAQRVVREAEREGSLDAILALMPGGKVDAAALLPRVTLDHYKLGAASAFVFLIAIALCFPTERHAYWPILLAALFTASLGILLLLGVQWAALHSGGIRVHGRGALVVAVLWLIGMSYRAALDPTMPWALSFLGYTFGVGLCEEFCKALPVVWLVFDRSPGWRAAARIGLASGVGFGVSEGLHYAATQYNGIAPGDIYLVRFVSCVALHAIWAGAGAILLWKLKLNADHAEENGWQFLMMILKAVAVPMVLHGLYNTCLKTGMNSSALAVAAVSLGWLAWQVESVRKAEGAVLDELTPLA